MPVIITIDGPAGAGKSSAAKLVAKALDLPVLDTGSLYRAVAWMVCRQGVSYEDEAGCAGVVQRMQIEIPGPGLIAVNSCNISNEIRTPEATAGSSKVAALPMVRALLIDLQRNFGSYKGCVIEGRDTGTIIFPDAPLKIFLKASPSMRYRRVSDLLGPKAASYNHERDQREMTRAIAPLIPAADAIIIDSTYLSQKQVVEQIVKLFGKLSSKADVA